MRKSVSVDAASMDEKIFAEAVRMFRQKGYHAASMQNIADAVGLQKGSLYHYISSKEELLFKIFERSTGALTQQLEAAHQELFNLRFRLAARQLVNHRELPRMKKRIARIETLIKERELGSVTKVK